MLVRGYWGDIVNSPYISFGEEVWEAREKEYFFKKVNFQSVYSNTEISSYNVTAYITKLEEMTKYEYPFERIKHLMKQDNEAKDEEKKDNDKKLDTIPEEEEAKIEEITDEQAEQIKREQDEKKTKEQVKDASDLKKTMMEEGKTIDLNDLEEGTYDVKDSMLGTRQLLQGFKRANVKIHLLSDDLSKLYSKSKYHDLFDIGVLSVQSSNKIAEDFNILFKKGALVHVETADMIVPLRKEQRVEYRKKIFEKTVKAGWVHQDKKQPFSHHLLFEVDKDETAKSSTAASTDFANIDNIDDINLDDL